MYEKFDIDNDGRVNLLFYYGFRYLQKNFMRHSRFYLNKVDNHMITIIYLLL
jgi:hypothetical protein